MAMKLTKRPIGVEDIAFDANGADDKFEFTGSDGKTHEARKINAKHLPVSKNVRNVLDAVNVEDALLAILEQLSQDGQATETVAGIARIATALEVSAGLSDKTIITPKKLAALVATSAALGMVKLATASDVLNGTNSNSVLTVGLANNLGGLPSGMGPFPWYFSNIPVGYLKADGATYSRALYANLWNAVKDDAVTDQVWNAGQFTKFSNGDGATTFRMPDLRGLFMRGVDGGAGRDKGAANRVGGSGVGSFQDCGLPNITATGGYSEKGGTTCTGAFYNSEDAVYRGSNATDNGNNCLCFDASKSNSIYGASEEVVPKNFSVHWMFKV